MEKTVVPVSIGGWSNVLAGVLPLRPSAYRVRHRLSLAKTWLALDRSEPQKQSFGLHTLHYSPSTLVAKTSCLIVRLVLDLITLSPTPVGQTS